MRMRLTGYADKFGVHPGRQDQVLRQLRRAGRIQAEIVKMINGDTNPRGPGFIEKPIKADCNGDL